MSFGIFMFDFRTTTHSLKQSNAKDFFNISTWKFQRAKSNFN